MRLVVTRPREEASATSAALAKLGHDVMIEPMLTIVSRAPVLDPDGFDAVAVTSANAIAAVAERPEAVALRRLPLVAVGHRAAAVARQAGFGEAAAIGPDVVGLADWIRRNWQAPRRILYLAGTDRAADLGALLERAGHHVHLAVVYEARATQALSPMLAARLRERSVDGVLHYSARTAQAFVACARRAMPFDNAWLRHFCLSPRVADMIRGAGARNVLIADRPDEAALFALLQR